MTTKTASRILISAPCHWPRLSDLVPGTGRGKCQDCGVEVWVSPSSVEMLVDHPDMPLLCFPCADKWKATLPPDDDVAHIGVAQRAELKRMGWTDEMIESAYELLMGAINPKKGTH